MTEVVTWRSGAAAAGTVRDGTAMNGSTLVAEGLVVGMGSDNTLSAGAEVGKAEVTMEVMGTGNATAADLAAKGVVNVTDALVESGVALCAAVGGIGPEGAMEKSASAFQARSVASMGSGSMLGRLYIVGAAQGRGR